MANIDADKARELLASAWSDQKSLRAEVEAAPELTERQILNLLAKLSMSSAKIAAAHVYAQLASSGPVVIENVSVTNPVTPEEPLDEDNGTAFDQFMGNPLDLLEGVVGIARAFAPRPVKDSPQA